MTDDQFNALNEKMDLMLQHVDKRFKAVDKRFDAFDKRFDAFEKQNSAEHAQMFAAIERNTVAIARLDQERLAVIARQDRLEASIRE